MYKFSSVLYRLLLPFLSLSRASKILLAVWIDGFLFLAAWLGAYFITYSNLSLLEQSAAVLLFGSGLVISLSVMFRLGLYRALVRFIGLKAALAIALGSLFSAVSWYVGVKWLQLDYRGPVVLNYLFLSFLFVAGWRLALRQVFAFMTNKSNHRVVIFGAGASGRQLMLALVNSPEYEPVAFVDDDVSLHNTLVSDLRVHNPADLAELIQEMDVSRILLAVPSSSRAIRAKIVERLEPLGIPVLTIPGMADLVDGKMQIDDLQDVKVEDLLGRDAVEPIPALISANIYQKVVMVTGAGGSIGSELCRQIIRQSPTHLVLYEVSEYSLYEIDKELQQLVHQLKGDVSLLPVIGSVQNRERLEKVMRQFNVQTVYHAAAYKHVPLVEYNVVEGLRNNVFGTMETAEAAIATGVETFVLISTDKAVRPTNVMGTTKRLAELVLQGLAKRQSSTRFCMVRFGNVLGSSGSVVPLFRKQIKAGGPITLTHQDITRYFMTIPEAAQLVIQAGAMGKGGDVFVLDMGEPVRIYDLAIKMVRLSGLEIKSKSNPDGDIEIRVTGLRPGEKLYEELLIGEEEKPTRHPRIRSATEVALEWPQMAELLAKLGLAAANYDLLKIRQLMLAAPTGFNPTDGICDLLQ